MRHWHEPRFVSRMLGGKGSIGGASLARITLRQQNAETLHSPVRPYLLRNLYRLWQRGPLSLAVSYYTLPNPDVTTPNLNRANIALLTSALRKVVHSRVSRAPHVCVGLGYEAERGRVVWGGMGELGGRGWGGGASTDSSVDVVLCLRTVLTGFSGTRLILTRERESPATSGAVGPVFSLRN